jgi:hypothetical protein
MDICHIIFVSQGIVTSDDWNGTSFVAGSPTVHTMVLLVIIRWPLSFFAVEQGVIDISGVATKLMIGNGRGVNHNRILYDRIAVVERQLRCVVLVRIVFCTMGWVSSPRRLVGI